MSDIKYPVKYDEDDQIVVDASGKTICLISWPNCGLTPDICNGRGREIELILNLWDKSRKGEVIDIPVKVDPVVTSVSEPSLLQRATEAVGSVFRKGRKVKKVNKYYKAKVRKYIDEKGKEHIITGSGRARTGWKLVLDDKLYNDLVNKVYDAAG